MTDLKPCPFCGSDAIEYQDSSHVSASEVECTNESCSAKPSVWGKTKAEAIAAWNSRAPTAAEAGVDTYANLLRAIEQPATPTEEEWRAVDEALKRIDASPPIEMEGREISDEMVERAAKATYAALPNFGMEWRPNTAGGHSQVRVDDAWEDAPDRHADCRRQARAALTAALNQERK